MKIIASILIVFTLLSVYFASSDALGKNMSFIITSILLLISFVKNDVKKNGK